MEEGKCAIQMRAGIMGDEVRNNDNFKSIVAGRHFLHTLVRDFDKSASRNPGSILVPESGTDVPESGTDSRPGIRDNLSRNPGPILVPESGTA